MLMELAQIGLDFGSLGQPSKPWTDMKQGTWLVFSKERYGGRLGFKVYQWHQRHCGCKVDDSIAKRHRPTGIVRLALHGLQFAHVGDPDLEFWHCSQNGAPLLAAARSVAICFAMSTGADDRVDFGEASDFEARNEDGVTRSPELVLGFEVRSLGAVSALDD